LGAASRPSPAGNGRYGRAMKIRRAGPWLLTLPGLAWAVLRFFGWEPDFLVPAFAFTPYVAAWTLAPAMVTMIRRRWLAVAPAATAVLIMAWCVLPRAVPDRGPHRGEQVAVMTINMFEGHADPAAIVKLVRDNDVAVLAVQEFTPDARARLRNAGLEAILPNDALADEAPTTGSGLYSRFPIVSSYSERGGGGNLQVYATIQPPGTGELDVVSVHPLAPYSLGALTLWRNDLAAEPAADPHGRPRILLGDFNSTLDHAPLRKLIARGYRDAADATGQGLAGTWGPYDGKPIPPVTLDHVLVDRRIGVRKVRVIPVAGSDHRSVLATLVVPKA
jgi:endonuclease/exonuclease/phosphatase family metal-dependent hydrolase